MSTSIQIKSTATSRSTAKLMKTGQITSYRTGDDGDLEAGRGLTLTLMLDNNPFGNNKRFTDLLGNQVYSDDIVIDWSTYDGTEVLGYRRTPSASAVNWDGAIDGALAVSIGTYTTGWRLPNIKELMNLLVYEGGADFTRRINYNPFNITETDLWTSTTLYGATTFAYQFGNNGTAFIYAGKSSSFKYIPCRTFTVTGTTLT